jgi:hypothetical protein
MEEQLIYHKLQQMPDYLKQEVLEFIGQLFSKHQLTLPNTQEKRKKSFGKYRGSLKSGLSIQEIDAQFFQLRSEWERPIC